MLKISIGKTKSYGEIAAAIGNPKAVRAVGGACGANPVPVLVPCHRVLAANKKLGGFSGGLDWKRSLLKREGVKFIICMVRGPTTDPKFLLASLDKLVCKASQKYLALIRIRCGAGAKDFEFFPSYEVAKK